jgi:hypothetical protein
VLCPERHSLPLSPLLTLIEITSYPDGPKVSFRHSKHQDRGLEITWCTGVQPHSLCCTVMAKTIWSLVQGDPRITKCFTGDEVPVRHMLQQKVLVVSSNGVAERSQIKLLDISVRARRCTVQRYYLVSCKQIFRISPRLQEILTTFFRGFIKYLTIKAQALL